MNRWCLMYTAMALCVVAIAFAARARADDGNDQSPQKLCRDADYADLHPSICAGPFSILPQGHGGGGGGLLSGILKGLGL